MLTSLDVTNLNYREINDRLRDIHGDVRVSGCCGQRFIAAGFSSRKIVIDGIPGNALGSYLNGAEIIVNGNAQDAVGDTMNDGKIVVNGDVGDAAGYAMRGGKLYIKGNTGYRTGIHMKEYQHKKPVIVIGGKCGSFLGEYQAGGIIIVLGLSGSIGSIADGFPFAGMHGGKVFLRTGAESIDVPENVTASSASAEDMSEIKEYISEFCSEFGYDMGKIMDAPFTKIVPDSANPYKRMYAAN